MNPAFLIIPAGVLLLAMRKPKPPPPPPPQTGGLRAISQKAWQAAKVVAPGATSRAEAAAELARKRKQEQPTPQQTPGLQRRKWWQRKDGSAFWQRRNPGQAARNRAARHRGRAARLRSRAQQLRSQGVFVDEVIGHEVTSAGEARYVFTVGELSRWMEAEARTAGGLLRQAARCSSPRRSRYTAHGWRITYNAPPFGEWSIVANWERSRQPTPDDVRYLDLIARNAGARDRSRSDGRTWVYRWRGRV